MGYAMALSVAAMVSVFIPAAFGGIYSWMDENGIRNFSNVKPPHSEALDRESIEKRKEIPHDREADLNRTASERIAREKRRLDLLKRQQESAEKRLRAANRKAEMVMEEAEKLSQKIDSAKERAFEDARKQEDRDGYRVIRSPEYRRRRPKVGYSGRHPVLGINSIPRHEQNHGPRPPDGTPRDYKSHIKQYYRKHGYIHPKPGAHGPNQPGRHPWEEARE